MTAEQFETFWTSTYPNTIPMAHCFKHDYKERWFRIHSLPESQRYANTDQAWEILLHRQNKIIADLIGHTKNLLLVIGEYDFDGKFDPPTFLENELLADFVFTGLKPIDLHKLDADAYDIGTTYRPFFAELTWEQNKYDNMLRSIANDDLRAFFISIDKRCLIAPYDGGMDFVLESSKIRDDYKNNYTDWLSSHPEGL
ncbi:MAG: DUF3885 domain-containing protein [Bacteroidia bacterium]